MDPNANLAEQLRIAHRLQEISDTEIPEGGDTLDVEAANLAFDLAELVIALDEWLRRSGFAPGAWPRSRISEGDAE